MVDFPVRQVEKEMLQKIKERPSEHTGKQLADVLVQVVIKEMLQEIKDTPQQRILERIVESGDPGGDHVHSQERFPNASGSRSRMWRCHR